MLATLCLMLASAGCAKPTVVIEHKIVWPWQKGVQFISLRKPTKPPEATPVNVQPATPEAKPTAAIHGSGRNQYILRNGLKHFWNGKHGADARWVASYRSCGAGGCSTRVSAIKPGE